MVETNKREAQDCYKGGKGYQPLTGYWVEQDIVLPSEFRNGNVWAGTEKLRVLKESLAPLPAGVSKVRVRSDSAGYQHDLMAFCADPNKERFGVIEFAIGVKVSEAFKTAVREVEESEWHRLYRKLIKLPGRVLDHARTLIVRLVGGHPSNETLFEARRTLVDLCESG